jgi:hypothetical protein
MAQAVLTLRDEPSSAGDELTLKFHVSFLGRGVPNGYDGDVVTVTIDVGHTPEEIADAVADAVQARAAELNYVIDDGTILMPAFMRR